MGEKFTAICKASPRVIAHAHLRSSKDFGKDNPAQSSALASALQWVGGKASTPPTPPSILVGGLGGLISGGFHFKPKFLRGQVFSNSAAYRATILPEKNDPPKLFRATFVQHLLVSVGVHRYATRSITCTFHA